MSLYWFTYTVSLCPPCDPGCVRFRVDRRGVTGSPLLGSEQVQGLPGVLGVKPVRYWQLRFELEAASWCVLQNTKTSKNCAAAQENVSSYLNKEQSSLCASPPLLTPLPLPLPLPHSCVSSCVHSPCDLFKDNMTLDRTEPINMYFSLSGQQHTLLKCVSTPVFLTAATRKQPPSLSWVWGVQVQSQWGQSCHLRFPGSEFNSWVFRIWIFLFFVGCDSKTCRYLLSLEVDSDS